MKLSALGVGVATFLALVWFWNFVIILCALTKPNDVTLAQPCAKRDGTAQLLKTTPLGSLGGYVMVCRDGSVVSR